MGAAQSSNVASAVSNVASFISNSTVANVAQAQEIQNSTDFTNCDVKLSGDLNITDVTNVIQQSTQIAYAKNDASVANNIQQQMLQEATSQVGFLGIGYADANNSCNEMVNASSNISNAMTTSASQFEQVSSEFICDNSTIIANNLNIGFTNTGSMIANQTLNNDQVANITNNISQTVTQKATATVQGISSFLILIVIIIAIIVWGVTRTLSSAGVRVAVTIILFVAVAGVLSFMYIKSTPPFFAQPSKCLKNCPIGLGGSNCVDYTPQEYNLTNAPLKYSIALYPSAQTTTGGNLLQMVIANASGQNTSTTSNNGGYNMQTKLALDSLLSNYVSLATRLGISAQSPLPNPLYNAWELIGNGKGGSEQYLQIPSQYLPITQQSQGDSTVASCTPNVLQAQIGAVPVSGCANVMDPNNMALLPSGANMSLALANLNDINVETFISSAPNQGNDTQLTRSLFTRFVFCNILGIQPLNIYVNQNEPVTYLASTGPTFGLPIDAPSECYQFTPSGIPDPIWSKAISFGGYLTGEVGNVNDNEYKFNNFMGSSGKYILIALIIIAVICIFWTWFSNRKANATTNSNKN